MSRLWDTPEFWARSEADDALHDMPNVAPAALADAFERSAVNYVGDPELVAFIAAELRCRAAAGIRFWADPRPFHVGSVVTLTANHGIYATMAQPN